MKKTYSKSSRQGLPGGPNEMFEKVKGIIVSERGQWDFPGMNTMVPTDDGRITMRGVPYPVYGQDETGYDQMMYPGQEYQFPGNNVLELPMAQKGLQKKLKPWEYLDKEGGLHTDVDLLPNDPQAAKKYAEELNWMRNWIPNRQSQMQSAIKSYMSRQDEKHPVDALAREYIFSPLFGEPSAYGLSNDWGTTNQELGRGILKNAVNNVNTLKFKDSSKVNPESYVPSAWGTYTPYNHSIYFLGQNPGGATKIHEIGHGTRLAKQKVFQDVIQHNLKNDPIYKSNYDNYDHSPEEIYSKIWEIRKGLNLKPTDKVTKELLKKKLNENKNSEEYIDLFKYLKPDTIVKLLNELVYQEPDSQLPMAQVGLQTGCGPTGTSSCGAPPDPCRGYKPGTGINYKGMPKNVAQQLAKSSGCSNIMTWWSQANPTPSVITPSKPSSSIKKIYKKIITPIVQEPQQVNEIETAKEKQQEKDIIDFSRNRNIVRAPFQTGPNQYEDRVRLITPLHEYIMNLDQYSKLLPTDSIPQEANFLYRLNRQQLGGALFPAAVIGAGVAGSQYFSNPQEQVKYQNGGSLPKAQLGNYIPSWLNPYNWGVTNRDDAGDFKKAFRAARIDGDDQFMWHGKRYSTKLTPASEEEKPKSNVLDLDNALDYLVETRGGTRDLWGHMADTIGYHESGHTMDPLQMQNSGGPGRGIFQFEAPSLITAQNRYNRIADRLKLKPDPKILSAKSALELSPEQQYSLFLINLSESQAKLKDYADNKLPLVDLWLQGHKRIEKDENRESFRTSVQKAKDKSIQKGYDSFKQLGGALPRFQNAGQFNPQLARPNPITGLYNWEKPRVKPTLSDFEPKQKAAPRSSTSVATKSDPVKAARQINSVAAEEYERNRQGVIRATNRPVSVFRPGAGDPEAVMEYTGVPSAVRIAQNPESVNDFLSGVDQLILGSSPVSGMMGMRRDFTPEETQALLDYSTVATMGLPLVRGAGKLGAQGLKQTGKYLTQGPLRNASKLNSRAWKPDPDSYYRMGKGRKFVDDVIETNKVRAYNENSYVNLREAGKISGIREDGKIVLKAKTFPEADTYWSKGVPLDGRYSPRKYGDYMIEASNDIPFINAVNQRTKQKGFWDAPDVNYNATHTRGQYVKPRQSYDYDIQGNIKPSIGTPLEYNPNLIKLYEPHWWKGYKPINTPKQLPGSSNVAPQQKGFFNIKGAFQKYPKGKLTQEEIADYKNSNFYKKNTQEYLDYKNIYGDSWTLPNFAEDAIIEGDRDKINRILYGGRNWRTSDYVVAGLVGTAYPGTAGIMGLAFSPPVVKNRLLPKIGLTNRPASLSSRDTTIDLTNRNMDFAKVNEFKDGEIIIGGEFIENANNSVRKAKDWLNAIDTYSDKKYPSKDIQSFYGIENGKFKVGKASEFKPETEIVPRRFGAVNINKAVLNNNKMRLLDEKGNPIYQNTPNTGKFILYSPSTKKAEFNYINTGKSGVDKVNKFLKNNKDAQYIHLDNGRYEFYSINDEGLTNYDYQNYYQQDMERKGHPGYNLILKKLGGALPKAQVGDEIFPGEGQYYNIPEYTYNYKRGFDDLPTPRYTGPLMNQRLIDEATQREYEQRRRAIDESVAAAREPLSTQRLARESAATGDKFSLQMNLGDPYNNPRLYETLGALDFINPGVMLGDMVTGLGSVPYNVQEGNYGAAAVGLGLPLATGALASIGVKSPRQFINNLVNPVAGIGDTPKQLPGSPNVVSSIDDVGKSLTQQPIYRGVYINDEIRNLPKFKGRTDDEILDIMGTTIPGNTGTRRKSQLNQTLNFGRDYNSALEHIGKFTDEGAISRLGNTKDLTSGQMYILKVQPDDLPFISAEQQSKLYKQHIDAWKKNNPDAGFILGDDAKKINPELLKEFGESAAFRTEGTNVFSGNFPQYVGAENTKIGKLLESKKVSRQDYLDYLEKLKINSKPINKNIFKLVNNGMSDMTNPNIYKALAPVMGIGAGAYGVNQIQNTQPTMRRFGGNLNFQKGGIKKGGIKNLSPYGELQFYPTESGVGLSGEAGLDYQLPFGNSAYLSNKFNVEPRYGSYFNPGFGIEQPIGGNRGSFFMGAEMFNGAPRLNAGLRYRFEDGGSLPTAGDPVLNFIQRQSPRFSKSKK